MVGANTSFNWVFILINLIWINSLMVMLSTLDYLWRHCWPNLFHWIVSVSRCEQRHVKYINSFEPREQSALCVQTVSTYSRKQRKRMLWSSMWPQGTYVSSIQAIMCPSEHDTRVVLVWWFPAAHIKCIKWDTWEHS